MSGGVDSSVSAALLKKAGYDVTGVFIKTWSPDWLPCTWKEERRDAMRIAAKLQISLLTLDLEEEYKKGVAEYMIEGYRKGIVPNPDVMCNKIIKFGAFFDFAMKQGADMVATGHYANVTRDNSDVEIFNLIKSKDVEKDQTYFLWTLGQKQLSRTLFPIGNLLKSDVRKLAKKFELPNAEKKDSQGLCFMGNINVKDFLKHYIQEKEGDVLDERGEVIGKHNGATFFTIGERHGFTIDKKGADDKPYYVITKEIDKNILVVSNKQNDGKIIKDTVVVKDVNWNTDIPPESKKKYQARIRYRQELQNCTLHELSNGNYQVKFEQGQIAPSSGQSVVFYLKNSCLGGGVIV